MANWDHRNNIGTHPILDPDPDVRRPHIVAAAEREIAKFSAILEREQGLKGQTVVVTIGRNIGDSPMSLNSWDAFQAHLGQYLRGTLSPEFFATFDGAGEWDGVAEQSTTFVASGVTSTAKRADLQGALASFAHAYRQDAIALTVGGTTLVESA